MGENNDMGASPDGDRACALRAEPAAQSQAKPLVPSAARRYRSLYSPERGMIACVLLQAGFGGAREPCHMFGSGDWEVGFPDNTFGWVEMAAEEWRALGMLTREERVAAWQDVIAARGIVTPAGDETQDAPEPSPETGNGG